MGGMYYLRAFETALVELARHLGADLSTSIDLVEGKILRSLSEAVAFKSAVLSERHRLGCDLKQKS